QGRPRLAPITSNDTTMPFLYEYPTLVADPGLHTEVIRGAAIDKAGTIVVTGSDDKSIRVWSLVNGQLLQTMRMPSGPGYVGRVYAVALSSNGDVIAAGGWTRGVEGEESIYILHRSGYILSRINRLSDVATKLAFSLDDRFLAAALGDNSLHIYDNSKEWA